MTAAPRRARIEDVVSIMNRAATEDLRATRVWPIINRVLSSGPPPDALTAQAADLVTAWGAAGGSLLDSDLDGFIDAPGAAVMEARGTARRRRHVVRPGTAPRRPGERSNRVTTASVISDGWYGYVDKDLRTLLGDRVQREVQAPLLRRRRAGDVPRVALDGDRSRRPRSWRRPRGPTRRPGGSPPRASTFVPGFIPETMRFTNRSTFQQVIRFARPRS